MKRGCFITLEGGEGTGKSTQTKALMTFFETQGITTHQTREPGGTPGAEIIRELLLSGRDEKWNMRTETLLFAAARAEHCVNFIRPALERGEWVVCDRYIDSSRAYQSVGGDLSDEEILALHKIGSEGLMPDRTFVLDMPEEMAARRAEARDRGDSDRIGGRDSSYHQTVMENFRWFAENDPERICLIDASASVEEITEALIQNLSDLIE